MVRSTDFFSMARAQAGALPGPDRKGRRSTGRPTLHARLRVGQLEPEKVRFLPFGHRSERPRSLLLSAAAPLALSRGSPADRPPPTVREQTRIFHRRTIRAVLVHALARVLTVAAEPSRRGVEAAHLQAPRMDNHLPSPRGGRDRSEAAPADGMVNARLTPTPSRAGTVNGFIVNRAAATPSQAAPAS